MGHWLVLLFISEFSWAGPLLNFPGPESVTLNKFEEFHRSYFQRFCSAQQDQRYLELLKNYRGDGYYVPEKANGKLDTETIKTYLPQLEKKLTWINQNIATTEAIKKFPQHRSLTFNIRHQINLLLDHKRRIDFTNDDKIKRSLTAQNQNLLAELKKDFLEFTEKVPFLLSYGYPVDHLSNRLAYEKLKTRTDAEGMHQANLAFFKRRLHEDGAYDQDRSHSDLFLRSSIDTIALEIQKPSETLSEDLRHDLEWTLDQTEQFLRGGKKRQIQRLIEWRDRSAKMIEFYRDALAEASDNSPLARKAKATAELRSFIYNSHAEVYHFMSSQPEWLKALFVIEKILTHEVGDGSSVTDLDRMDVAQVVVNRLKGDRFNNIPPQDALYPYLSRLVNESELKNNKWLNILFKEGEFSFTYFFIPAVSHIACPDQSLPGRRLRRSNAELAIHALQQPKKEFHAERYFSRISMTGKINMAKVWDNYSPLAPRAGEPTQPNRSVKRAFNRKKYRYFYSFKDESGQLYSVIEIFKQPWVVNSLRPGARFYTYRNPHAFTYFEPEFTQNE